MAHLLAGVHMATILRNFTAESGARSGIRLDASAWAAVDEAAAEAGLPWAEWVKQAIASHPNASTMTTAVRMAITEFGLRRSIIYERAEAVSQGQHPLLRDAVQLDDAQLHQLMKECEIEGSVDCIGFALHIGREPSGRTILWIENGLKNGTSVGIPLDAYPKTR